MKTGRPPTNSKLGKPTVIKLVFQAAESKNLEHIRRMYRRSLSKQTFPSWLKTAASMEVHRRAREAGQFD